MQQDSWFRDRILNAGFAQLGHVSLSAMPNDRTSDSLREIEEVVLNHTLLMDRPTPCRSFLEELRVNHLRPSQKALESLLAFLVALTADENGRRERENALPLPCLCHHLQADSHGPCRDP